MYAIDLFLRGWFFVCVLYDTNVNVLWTRPKCMPSICFYTFFLLLFLLLRTTLLVLTSWASGFGADTLPSDYSVRVL